jgi:hypothetical protein
MTEVDSVMGFSTPKADHCRSVPIPHSLVDALAEACADSAARNGATACLGNVFSGAVAVLGGGRFSRHVRRPRGHRRRRNRLDAG